MAGCCGDDEDQYVRIAGQATGRFGFQAGTFLDILKRGAPVETCPDPFVGVASVHGLNAKNFKPFLKQKTAALVLFYEKYDGGIVKTKRVFGQVASGRPKFNEAYAAVDCGKDKGFCMLQGVTKTPVLAVYLKDNKVEAHNRPDALDQRLMEQYFREAQQKFK